MPRNSVNWAAYDEAIAQSAGEFVPPTADIIFKNEISAETAKIHQKIKDVAPLSTYGVEVVGFATNQYPVDGYVRHMAMLAVLAEYGVVDQYLEEDVYEGLSQPNGTGWEAVLRIPGSVAVFKVSEFVVDQTSETRIKLRYQPIGFTS